MSLQRAFQKPFQKPFQRPVSALGGMAARIPEKRTRRRRPGSADRWCGTAAPVLIGVVPAILGLGAYGGPCAPRTLPVAACDGDVDAPRTAAAARGLAAETEAHPDVTDVTSYGDGGSPALRGSGGSGSPRPRVPAGGTSAGVRVITSSG